MTNINTCDRKIIDRKSKIFFNKGEEKRNNGLYIFIYFIYVFIIICILYTIFIKYIYIFVILYDIHIFPIS